MYCKNCGKELDDDVKFCTNCGASTSDNLASGQDTKKANSSPDKDKKEKKVIYYIAFAAAIIVIICSVLFAANYILPDNEQAGTTQTANGGNEDTSEQLLNEYFGDPSSVNGYITPDGNIAEHLVRGQNIFSGFNVLYTGTVNSLLTSEEQNGFAVSIESDYYYSDSSVSQIVAYGTYGDSEARLMQGDPVTVLGEFSGIEMYSDIDGVNAEYAVLRNCHITEDPEYPNGFKESDVRTVITTIFGQGMDIQKVTETGARSIDTYQFTRVVGSRMESWSFSEYGFCTVSFDGGNSEYSVMFAPDYKTYITYTYMGEPYTVRCYDINGTELWSRDFSSHQDCAFKNDRLYVYADNSLHIIDPGNGSDIQNPAYYADKSMLIASDRILLRDYSGSATDAVIALDLDGKMVWRTDIDNGFELSDLAISASGNELLFTYLKNDMSTYETYCRYKRINLENGEAVTSFKMPNDYN